MEPVSAASPQEGEVNFPQLRFLRRLTVFLGVLLAVGAIVVVAAIAVKLGQMGGSVAGGASNGGVPWQSSVTLESGERFVSATADRGRLYLHIKGPANDGGRVVVVESSSGRHVGTVNLVR